MHVFYTDLNLNPTPTLLMLGTWTLATTVGFACSSNIIKPVTSPRVYKACVCLLLSFIVYYLLVDSNNQ